ncbi:MAG: ABC transporter permease subunit [cyanobacterium endosymbiont of Rhopalodia fuxianensis]
MSLGVLPKALIEAAKVNGASHIKIFTKFSVPLFMPTLASCAVFQFLWIWNYLLIALVYLGRTPNLAPVTIQLSNIVSSLGKD